MAGLEKITNLIDKIKIKYYCDKGNHDWENCVAGNRVIEVIEEGNSSFVFADIPMRFCKTCRYEEERWFDNEWREFIKGRRQYEKNP